mgnify:CR=1 FL=1
MKKKIKQNWQIKTGAIIILIGALSIFPENDTWLHTTLQITFIIGCILFVYGGYLAKKNNNSVVLVALIVSFSLPISVSGQNYNKQVEAFEESFHQRDITIIQPFLSDSLRFASLPAQNTLPILTNIVTKLPELKSLNIEHSEKGKVLVKYDFEQLGISESIILFDINEKIIEIEFVGNLVRQEMEQQQKMRSSVQAPQPNKIAFKYSKKKVVFSSKDGLMISADLYEIDPNKPFILLCHQAGYNKYEYADIAPRLNKMGFNVLAIDQRSGGTFAGEPNETYNRAIERGIKKIDFTDALQDIESAIDFLSNNYKQNIIVWGSSYSSSLVLHIAEKKKNVKAVIAFSPGDYFGEKLPSLETVFPNIKQPFFVTSSREEAGALKALVGNVGQSKLQLQFIPETDGFHGSRALWIDQKGAEDYWVAVKGFLDMINHQ